MAKSNDQQQGQSPFRRSLEDDDENCNHANNDEGPAPPEPMRQLVDDFFDTSRSIGASHSANSCNEYHSPNGDRFVFDGEEEDVMIASPNTPTSPFSYSHTSNGYSNQYSMHNHNNSTTSGGLTQPLLLHPQYTPDGNLDIDDTNHEDDDNDTNDNDNHSHRLRLPFARYRQQRQQQSQRSQDLSSRQRRRRRRRRWLHDSYAPDLSGLNVLNLVTFLAVAAISIIVGSGVVGQALARRGHKWLPSTWDVTREPALETLLTPAVWAGQWLWIPSLVLEGIFCLVQLLPEVRTRPEVTSGIGFFYFYIGLLQVLTTIFFCVKWIIPAWVTLAMNVVCLVLLLHFQQPQHYHNSHTNETSMTPTNVDINEASSPSSLPLISRVFSWEYWVFRFPFDVHLGWLLPLLASRGSMIFRYYGNHDMGLQLAADIVAMALLLPIASAYVIRAQGPPDWVIPLLILWSYIGTADRLVHAPDALVEAYGADIVVAVRDAAWTFAGAVGLLVLPSMVIWVAREFLTIHVVQLTDLEEADEDVEDLVILHNDPTETLGDWSTTAS